jgi:DNA-binding MarR family transcriptional regulator
MRPKKTHAPRITIAFLLAQVGARSAQEFSKLLVPIDLSPPDAGILRLLSLAPGLSQQELAGKLGMHASRLVAMIDALEERRLVTRQPDASDRRIYRLQLSDEGRATLAAISRAADAHENIMCAALSVGERSQLRALLEKVAAHHELAPGIHPGYRAMGKAQPDDCPPGQRGKLRG